MNRGTYIKLYRKVLDHPLFNQKPYDDWRAFEYLLMKARIEPGEIVLKDGTIIRLQRGQHFESRSSLAQKFGWSVKKVIGWEKRMSNLKMGHAEGHAKGIVYTIENYTFYQGEGQAEGQAEGQTEGKQRANRGQRKKNDKNDKNNNNYKEKINKKESGFAPPSVEEVRQYCAERQNGIDAEIFVDFYASKGWMIGKNKMKDWKAAVRTWERTQDEKHNGMASHTQPKRTGTDWNALTANG